MGRASDFNKDVASTPLSLDHRGPTLGTTGVSGWNERCARCPNNSWALVERPKLNRPSTISPAVGRLKGVRRNLIYPQLFLSASCATPSFFSFLTVVNLSFVAASPFLGGVFFTHLQIWV
ncbi:hypothetical protein VTI28DRAFT_8203 [Corynascus sepedonium]